MHMRAYVKEKANSPIFSANSLNTILIQPHDVWEQLFWLHEPRTYHAIVLHEIHVGHFFAPTHVKTRMLTWVGASKKCPT